MIVPDSKRLLPVLPVTGSHGGERVSIVRSFWRKLTRALRLYGVVGTAKYSGEFLRNKIRNTSVNRQRNAVQATFDRKFDVDTAGIISLSSLDVDTQNWVHGHNYGPTSPGTFDEVMDVLDIDFSDFTFVDYGSGKAAVLLYAAALPFKEIIGVEFSQQLHDIAVTNIAKHPLTSGGHVRAVHGDAAQFPIPDGPLLAFFNKPFSLVIMDSVLDNIRESLRNSPRRVYVCTVRMEERLEESASGNFLKVLSEGTTRERLKYRIYYSDSQGL